MTEKKNEQREQHIVSTVSGGKCSHANSYVTRKHPDDGEEHPWCRWCREFLEL